MVSTKEIKIHPMMKELLSRLATGTALWNKATAIDGREFIGLKDPDQGTIEVFEVKAGNKITAKMNPSSIVIAQEIPPRLPATTKPLTASLKP